MRPWSTRTRSVASAASPVADGSRARRLMHPHGPAQLWLGCLEAYAGVVHAFKGPTQKSQQSMEPVLPYLEHMMSLLARIPSKCRERWRAG